MRRRVDKDPASVAFASLAEELRKAGEHEEAVRVCRAGLEHHPVYLSARVTLGRALLELEQYPEARTELEYVLTAAPDNLLAQKGMSLLRQRAASEPADTAPATARPSLSFASPPAPTALAEPEPLLVPVPEPEQASPPPNPALDALDGWQARIQADRARRTGESL